MDKKVAGVFGAVAALTSLDCTQAAASPSTNPDAMRANNYAELLNPIPNAVELLIADDAARAAKPEVAQSEEMKLAAHHHHHHHRYHRRYRHHHHHHHGFLEIQRKVG